MRCFSEEGTQSTQIKYCRKFLTGDKAHRFSLIVGYLVLPSKCHSHKLSGVIIRMGQSGHKLIEQYVILTAGFKFEPFDRFLNFKKVKSLNFSQEFNKNSKNHGYEQDFHGKSSESSGLTISKKDGTYNTANL